MASRAYVSARTSIFRTIGGPLSRKSHYSPSEVIAREALLKTLRPWSALSLVRVKRSLGALTRRLVRTGSSPASRYSVVNRGYLLSLHLYSFSGRSGAYFYASAEKFLRYFFIFFPITAIPRETVVWATPSRRAISRSDRPSRCAMRNHRFCFSFRAASSIDMAFSSVR